MVLEAKTYRWLIFLISIAGCVAGALIKGPSLDEYWTLVYADPKAPWSDAWVWWSSDTGHPPGYYAIIWLAGHLFPMSVHSARLINLVFLISFGWYCLFFNDNKNIRSFSVLFYTSIIGSYYFIERFAESRAYFVGLILLAFLVIEIKGLERNSNNIRRFIRLLLASVFVSFINYPAFCAAIALLTAASIFSAVSMRYREAIFIALILTASVSVALACLWNSMGYERVLPPYYVSMVGYFKSVAGIILAAVLGNLAISALAINQARESGSPEEGPNKIDWYKAKYIFLFALLLSVIGYALLNVVLQALLSRQLVSFVPLMCGTLAAWCSDRALSRNSAFLIFIAMLLSQGLVLLRLSGTPNFYRHAPLLAYNQSRCEGFRIIALDPEELGEKSNSLSRQLRKAAHQLAYAEISRKFHFSIASPSSRALNTQCGGAVWILFVWLDDGDTTAALLERLSISIEPAQADRAKVYYQDNSLVILVPRNGALHDPSAR